MTGLNRLLFAGCARFEKMIFTAENPLASPARHPVNVFKQEEWKKNVSK